MKECFFKFRNLGHAQNPPAFKINSSQNPPESKSTQSKLTGVKIYPIKIHPSQILPDQNLPSLK